MLVIQPSVLAVPLSVSCMAFSVRFPSSPDHFLPFPVCYFILWVLFKKVPIFPLVRFLLPTFFGSVSFRVTVLGSRVRFRCLMRKQAKQTHFAHRSEKKLLPFRFVWLRTGNERRTLWFYHWQTRNLVFGISSVQVTVRCCTGKKKLSPVTNIGDYWSLESP
jgi:hypothetical protein